MTAPRSELRKAARSRPVLRHGDGFAGDWDARGHVRDVQRVLCAEGLLMDIDGLFGDQTESAVMIYQVERGLRKDGVVGPLTWAALLTEASAGELATFFPTTLARSYLHEHLEYAERYRAHIEASSAKRELPTCLIAGIGSRESGWGLYLTPQTPAGTGDGGHGRGLMQIDDRYHAGFIESGDWTEPARNIEYGTALLARYLRQLETTGLEGRALLRAGLAAYNCGTRRVRQAVRSGRDVDFFTTGRDYSSDVLNRAGWFQREGWS